MQAIKRLERYAQAIARNILKKFKLAHDDAWHQDITQSLLLAGWQVWPDTGDEATRARVTQIMNLLHLAPDIQEEILFLPTVARGRDPVPERHFRPLAGEILWSRQRQAWRRMLESANVPSVVG